METNNIFCTIWASLVFNQIQEPASRILTGLSYANNIYSRPDAVNQMSGCCEITSMGDPAPIYCLAPISGSATMADTTAD